MKALATATLFCATGQPAYAGYQSGYDSWSAMSEDQQAAYASGLADSLSMMGEGNPQDRDDWSARLMRCLAAKNIAPQTMAHQISAYYEVHADNREDSPLVVFVTVFIGGDAGICL